MPTKTHLLPLILGTTIVLAGNQPVGQERSPLWPFDTPRPLFTGESIAQPCGDGRDVIATEYRHFGVQGWQPSCREFTDTGALPYFTWAELNGGFSNGNPHSPWGYVAPALATGLDQLLTHYNGYVSLSSGYRCPHGNTNVGSKYPTTSRHMFGLAVDIRTGTLGAQYDSLRTAATNAGAEWVSERDDYEYNIIHVQWSHEEHSTPLARVSAGGQRTQSEIAEDLRQYSGQAERREDQHSLADLLREVSSIPVDERGQDLRDALIGTLLVSQQADTWSYADHETPFFLLQAVVELEDPAAIPALTHAMGTGLLASRALIAFGVEAATHVLDVVASSTPMTDTRLVAGGLLTLRMMVERANSDDRYAAWLAEEETLSTLRSVTLRHLRPVSAAGSIRPPRYPSLVRAIDLAFVLEDDDLRDLLMMLASSEQAVIVRGVSGGDLVDRIQRQASERLEGLDPLPRR